MQDDIPPGYAFEPVSSAFINHVGRIYRKTVPAANGEPEQSWAALRIAAQHVNAWNFCHAGVITLMAEIGTGSPGWIPGGAPIVAIDLSVQFISAPKLGELLEVCGVLTKRTRTLVFSRAQGSVDGAPVFFAASIQKIIG
jgi:acyl-coenzyme A thioesterase PaaI-like protein